MQKYEDLLQTAVILAGGRSSRMGFDKQLLKKDDRTLAACLAESLLEVFHEVLVVTKTPQLYEKLPVRTCADIYPGQGPISGMHSAFAHCSSPSIFVMACDMTGFCADYARYQAEKMIRENADACVTMQGEKMEPFHGFYSRRLEPLMEERLLSQRTSIYQLLKNQKVSRISRQELMQFTDPQQIFSNLNTPQDYERFRSMLEKNNTV